LGANFRESPECELRRDGVLGSSAKEFVNDSSPGASMSELCNTAAGLRVLSPLYARRRE
jgi:hypothetical protein